jgi:mRNA interferase MazF
MNVSRGDVVIFDAQFVSRPGGKRRPMLVVQNDRNNAQMSNTILAVITTNSSRFNEPTQVLIDPSTADGAVTGLRSISAISCENLITVAKSDIVKKIGHLSDAHMQLVDAALKVSLSLR